MAQELTDNQNEFIEACKDRDNILEQLSEMWLNRAYRMMRTDDPAILANMQATVKVLEGLRDTMNLGG